MFGNNKLIDKEEELVRLNTELDLQTKDLLSQVDHIMKLDHRSSNAEFEEEELFTSKGSEGKMLSLLNRGGNYKAKEKDVENGFDVESVARIHGLDNSIDAENRKDLLFSKLNKDDHEVEYFDHTGSEDSKEEKKQFFSLNREKSNKNLKSATCGKASIVCTTNIGQGLTFPGRLTRHKSEIRLKERTENVLPDSLKGLGQEGIVRFLKAKVKMLTEQMELLQKDEKKHVEKIKDLQSERERVSEDRDKWIQQANIAKNVLVKHEQHASNVVVQLQNAQAENGHLRKEIEKLKKEVKQINQNSGSNEVKLNRSIEEMEKLKITLRQAKQDEKDLRETQRKKTDELSGAVKRLDKQRSELLHAFKKQLVVIDNLKRQRGLMETGKLLKTIEDDFMEFLDWNPNKV